LGIDEGKKVSFLSKPSSNNDKRASQPYCFTPVGGAPSVKGKKIA
jgi:hypothetical protein